jgi:vancomycin permeability regulator SanA
VEALGTGETWVGPGDVQTLRPGYEDFEVEDGTMSGGNQAIAYREIMDIKTAANYLGVSRSHLREKFQEFRSFRTFARVAAH